MPDDEVHGVLDLVQRDIELSWLRAFMAVHESGSFTAAADRIHRAQSRVSAQVAHLERALGVQLFVRSRRATSLTEAGEELLPYVRTVLQQLTEGVSAATSQDGHVRGRVTVSAFPGAAAFVVAPTIRRFCDTYPQARVVVKEDLPNPATAVARGDTDLAVFYDGEIELPRSVRADFLLRERVVCVMPSDHPAVGMSAVPASIFETDAVILTSIANGYSDSRVILQQAGVRPLGEYSVGQPTTAKALVAVGVGLGLLPELAAAMLDTGDQVTMVPVDHPAFERDVHTLVNKERLYPPVIKEFIKTLHAQAREMDVASPGLALDQERG
ncbi:LysR family transcriptional regulator [Ruania alkalisoli]|uniref:LysR family transcriptional regulator n=1 Tax=Ruania alkalisoli TaxID=2779775 RepID=A0A7M1SSL9_9MICO|nr:LysR family transcriptional regulator [Ruania alkalisoli]QOR70568.1 LysR family transcriptional regulator [Ruania alkalisoli]